MTKTAEEYELALFRRLGSADLYRQLTEIARAALIDDNRCALALAIALLLSNFGVEEKIIKKFMTCQLGNEEVARDA